jgi:hypothetical protein
MYLCLGCTYGSWSRYEIKIYFGLYSLVNIVHPPFAMMLFFKRIYTWSYQRNRSTRSRVRFPDEFMEFFNWYNPSSRIMALGSIQPLTEMSTRNLPGGKRRPAGAWGWQPHCPLRADYLENVGSSTSHNPMDLDGLLTGILPFTSKLLLTDT